jgi:hypothetical protein
MALIAAVPDTAKLNLLTVAEHPIYVAFSTDDPLAYHKELHLQDLSAREWILPAQHAKTGKSANEWRSLGERLRRLQAGIMPLWFS